MSDHWKPDGQEYRPIPTTNNETLRKFLSEKKQDFYKNQIFGIFFGPFYFWILMKFYAQRETPAPEENLAFAVGALIVFSIVVMTASKYGPKLVAKKNSAK